MVMSEDRVILSCWLTVCIICTLESFNGQTNKSGSRRKLWKSMPSGSSFGDLRQMGIGRFIFPLSHPTEFMYFPHDEGEAPRAVKPGRGSCPQDWNSRAESAIFMERSTRPKHIYSIHRKNAGQEEGLMRSRSDCHLLHLSTQWCVYIQRAGLHPWALETQRRGVSRTILPTARLTVTSPSIRPFMALKGPIEFQIRPRNARSRRIRGRCPLGLQKGIMGQVDGKESAIGMNWIKELMELQNRLAMLCEFVDSKKGKLPG